MMGMGINSPNNNSRLAIGGNMLTTNIATPKPAVARANN